jgi:hypothetical protein
MIKLTLWISLFLSSYAMGDQQAVIQEVKPIIQKFGQSLKAELKGAMMSGGPVKGLTVCNIQAPVITNKASESNWEVARTSLKWRNDNNQPDQWEKEQLEMFERQLKAGTPANNLWAVKETENETRVMKAIMTQNICLACHGKTLSSDVQNKLDALYPEDHATGFSSGDIRGAFSLRKHRF